METSEGVRTIATVMRDLFPRGTRAFYAKAPTSQPWPDLPDFPPDLFGAVAYLLEIAGAYHYAIPSNAATVSDEPRFTYEPGEHEAWVKAGGRWAVTPLGSPALAKTLWRKLGRERDQPIFRDHQSRGEHPSWWKLALALLIIADEACTSVGFAGYSDDGASSSHWVSDPHSAANRNLLEDLLKRRRRGPANHIAYYPQFATLCLCMDPDVACVLPKSRTPSLGSTMRTLSRNVCLLPARGIAKASWQLPPEKLVPDDNSALNLLLIPYPYVVAANWFRGEPYKPDFDEDESDNKKRWGWFSLEQKWLTGHVKGAKSPAKARQERRAALARFVRLLIEQSKKDIGVLHGVIFPEYSLDWESFETIVGMIQGRFPEIQFFVAGSSTNCKGEHGNVALSTVFTRNDNYLSKEPVAISSSRAKHHRWRLDEPQISAYALASSLDPRRLWWEKTVVPKREIHVNVFRSASTFTTMICEDLARADPCHGVLRSMAPSLVFVLLMDGPQIDGRWSARYSTVLADDPGSSVLALTSMGLLERANRTARQAESRSIALWKEDTGKMVSIPLPRGDHAVVLTLSGYQTREETFDGRANINGRAWRFHGQQPIRLTCTSKPDSRAIALATGTLD